MKKKKENNIKIYKPWYLRLDILYAFDAYPITQKHMIGNKFYSSEISINIPLEYYEKRGDLNYYIVRSLDNELIKIQSFNDNLDLQLLVAAHILDLPNFTKEKHIIQSYMLKDYGITREE